MSELAILVPTRGRPQNIARVISAWDFTNAWDHADLILVVDADDPEIEGYRALHDPEALPLKIMEMPHWLPMVHKLDPAALAVAQSGDYFAVGFAGDDHLPQTIGWAKAYLDELHKLKTGMVYGDDGYQGKKLSTEWAVTADAIQTLGRMIPAPVEHMYCDNSIMEMFEAAGALRHLPHVRIEHMHPIAGKGQSDAQYERVNSREQFTKDRGAYENWKATQMRGHIAMLRGLRPDRPGQPTQRGPKRMSRSPFPRHFKQVKGVTPEEVGIALADFASVVPRDQAIVELGCYHGKTALQLAWGAAQGAGAHVWSIDPWELPGNVYGDEMGDMAGARAWARYWVRGLGYSNAVTLVHDFSQGAAVDWTGPLIGLLFVDGDHTYDGARQDIETWAPLLAPGARIAIDDYENENYRDVRRAVDDLVEVGLLGSIEVYHDRLGVTRLATGDRKPTAITSEGVSPAPLPVEESYHPYPAVADQVAVMPVEEIGPLAVAIPDSEVSNRTVGLDELEGVAAGTPLAELTLPQMRALAKARGIVLGYRKDKKADTFQALEEGR